VRAQIDVIVAVIGALEQQLELLEGELRRFTRGDQRYVHVVGMVNL
jgi:hypothetical protein